MLERKDINCLFELLALYRGGDDPHLSQKGLRSAWLLVLKPYDRDDVREAIGAWFRKNTYWPRPQEIAALCPHLPEETRVEFSGGPSQEPIPQDWMEMRERWTNLVELRRNAGIPATIREALDAGMAECDWLDILADRGLAWT